jgi:hypothetical protein
MLEFNHCLHRIAFASQVAGAEQNSNCDKPFFEHVGLDSA